MSRDDVGLCSLTTAIVRDTVAVIAGLPESIVTIGTTTDVGASRTNDPTTRTVPKPPSVSGKVDMESMIYWDK